MHDLHQLGSSLGDEYRKLNNDKFIKKLKDEAQYLKWRVSPDNAVRTLQPIVIPKPVFDTKNYRIVKPTEINKDLFNALFSMAQEYVADEDYGFDSEFPEGKEIERKHRLRERNQAVVQSAKEAFKQKNGKLYCQVCGFDFQAKYGDRIRLY